MSYQVAINPYTKTANKAILSTSVSLYNQAIVNVKALTDSNEVILNQNVVFTDEEYSQWGQDDAYLVNLALSKCGLSINSNPPVVEPSPMEVEQHQS